jgi:type IV pilus assembly protein PilC
LAADIETEPTTQSRKAGLPLLQGLRVLEEQERSGAMRKIIRGLCHSIESGHTFSEALAFYPKVFSKLS